MFCYSLIPFSLTHPYLQAINCTSSNANWSEAIPSFQDPIEVKIVLNENGLYEVILKSNETYQAPQNYVSTAQFTFTVPTGGFTVGQLESHIGSWNISGVFQKPIESENTDYFAFSLTGGKSEFSFEAGKEITIFSFKNTGICTGAVEILNRDDPFFPPNSANANIGNVINILGSGFGSAFEGPYDIGGANCLENNMPPLTSDSILIIPMVDAKSPTNGTIEWTNLETAVSYQVATRLKGESAWQISTTLKAPLFYYYLPINQIYEYQITTTFEDGTTIVSDVFEFLATGTE